MAGPVQPGGTLEAYRNVSGFANMPWAPGSVAVGTGFAGADRVRFADLDGDGKADLLYINPTAGRVRRDAVGGAGVLLATGFSDPTRTRFADLNGDGRAGGWAGPSRPRTSPAGRRRSSGPASATRP